MATLEVRGVSVRFGGLQALRDVSFHVNAGEIAGLIGPNGAGKTTLFNVVSGLQVSDAGRVRFKGEDVTGLAPEDRSLRGIGRTFQSVQVFRDLTVQENVMISREVREQVGSISSVLKLPWAQMESKRSREKVRAIFHFLELEPYRHALAGDLPLGIQRRVELARALAGDPALLLLDEAASGMDTRETRGLAEDLERIRSTLGITILLVEHDMRLVMEVCDYIYVLNFGEMMAEGRPAQIQTHPKVLEAYLGTSGGETVGVTRA